MRLINSTARCARLHALSRRSNAFLAQRAAVHAAVGGLFFGWFIATIALANASRQA